MKKLAMFSLKQRLRKPLIIRRVVGNSMEPTLRQDQLVVASSLRPPQTGQIVVAKLDSGREVVKRLQILGDTCNGFRLVGDNQLASTDYADSKVKTVYGGLIWPRT